MWQLAPVYPIFYSVKQDIYYKIIQFSLLSSEKISIAFFQFHSKRFSLSVNRLSSRQA